MRLRAGRTHASLPAVPLAACADPPSAARANAQKRQVIQLPLFLPESPVVASPIPASKAAHSEYVHICEFW
jgi:hypothetical protein